MRISTFGYVGKQGVKNIWRNKMFSLASIATMSACIFLFGLFFSIIVNFQHIIKTAEEGVAITVFFEEDATDSEKKAIGKALEARKDVAEVKYISAEEAWEEFQKQYFADNPELAEGFKNDNPLASSDNYEVYMKTAEDSKSEKPFSFGDAERTCFLCTKTGRRTRSKQVGRSSEDAFKRKYTCSGYFDRNYHYPSRSFDLPDQ